MAGCYAYLATAKYVAAFTVVYGLFLTFGELGPGDNIGLIASKTSATAIRGQYYGIAAAIGKVPLSSLSSRLLFLANTPPGRRLRRNICLPDHHRLCRRRKHNLWEPGSVLGVELAVSVFGGVGDRVYTEYWAGYDCDGGSEV